MNQLQKSQTQMQMSCWLCTQALLELDKNVSSLRKLNLHFPVKEDWYLSLQHSLAVMLDTQYRTISDGTATPAACEKRDIGGGIVSVRRSNDSNASKTSRQLEEERGDKIQGQGMNTRTCDISAAELMQVAGDLENTSQSDIFNPVCMLTCVIVCPSTQFPLFILPCASDNLDCCPLICLLMRLSWNPHEMAQDRLNLQRPQNLFPATLHEQNPPVTLRRESLEEQIAVKGIVVAVVVRQRSGALIATNHPAEPKINRTALPKVSRLSPPCFLPSLFPEARA